jgi:hypothetical protein
MYVGVDTQKQMHVLVTIAEDVRTQGSVPPRIRPRAGSRHCNGREVTGDASRPRA